MIEQIKEIQVDDDCIALVCYVDCGNLPVHKAVDRMKDVRDMLRCVTEPKGVKLVVLDNTYRLEVITKKPTESIVVKEKLSE